MLAGTLSLILAALHPAWGAAPGDSATGPRLLVPTHRDSALQAAPESPPAPLLVPGRPTRRDTLHKTRAEQAVDDFNLGIALERNKQPGAAIISYENALKLDPELRDAHYRMGMLYLSRDQVTPAVRHFAAEVRRHPDHFEAQRELGLGLVRLGDTTGAIARLESLTESRPRDDRSWSALAFAYGLAGRPEDAERSLRRAITLAPRRAEEHRDLAVLLAREGRDREARAEYRRALDIDPQDATVWSNLGNLERLAGNPRRALESYRKAEACDTMLAFPLQGQIAVLSELGRDREAGEVYWRWINRAPQDHEVRLAAVRFFAQHDQPDLAFQLAQDAVRLEPKSGDAHMILAVGLQANDRTRAALTELRLAESLFKDQPSLDQVHRLIAGLRAAAPDSLRSMFEADSLEHAKPKP